MVDLASNVELNQTQRNKQQKIIGILFHSFLFDIGFGIGFPFFIGLFFEFFTPEELLLISASIVIIPLLIYLILGYFYYSESKKMSQSLSPPLHIDDFLKIFFKIKRNK
ncbi:MAG: hypothetical protein ACFE8U_10910 [Candidatus Hermodarchaeota archaeon]